MTCIRILELLLPLLLVTHCQVSSEDPEPVFRARDSVIEMGYCFGVDYIVVYRCAPEGDQLLGNSSVTSLPVKLPLDLQGRVHINQNQQLLGLQINNLTHQDSGTYRRECWQNRTLVSQHRHLLTVCDEEVEAEEIILKDGGNGGAELLCNNTSIGSKGTSVRWYHEMYPLYRPTLFLDTSVSLDPDMVELQGVVKVRNSGALLLLDNSTLKNNQHFTCLVTKGETCLSFQNMHPPDLSESRDIYASQGEHVVLKCPSDGNNQLWETPLGRINGSSAYMHISFGDKSEDFSLVIPDFSDELSGDYSCISSSLEMQYFVGLCPKKEFQEKVAIEGESVLLDCNICKNHSQVVEWHHREPSGLSEVIHDSADGTVPIPENLRGRLSVSENGTALTISHLQAKDQGLYWCIVLGGSTFLEEEDDYQGNSTEEETGDDEFNEDLLWDMHTCICKQEILLNLKKIVPGEELEPVPPKPKLIIPKTSPTSNTPPGEQGNTVTIGVVVGVVLLVVGVIVAVIVVKKRKKASQKQRKAASGLNMDKDTNMDPDCNVRMLTHND